MSPWQIAVAPLLSTDGVQTDSLVLWYDIRGLRRLRDGRLIVVNGTLDVFVLDELGAFLDVFGGAGQGPGEFRAVTWVQGLAGDTLAFYDQRQRRVSFFDDRGDLVRSATVPRTDLKGVFEDGTFASSWNAAVPRPPGGPREGLYRELQIIRRHAGGDVLVFDTVPGDENAFTRTPPGSRAALSGQRLITWVTASAVSGVFRPSAHRQFWMAVGPRNVYVGSGGPDITSYGLDGDVQNVVTREYPRAAFNEEAVTRAGMEHSMGSILLRLPDELRPTELPVTTRFMVDDLEHLWVEMFPFDKDAPRRWSVFDPEGRFVVEVVVPNGLSPHHIGEDFILGVWKDELEVEYVHLYDFRR